MCRLFIYTVNKHFAVNARGKNDVNKWETKETHPVTPIHADELALFYFFTHFQWRDAMKDILNFIRLKAEWLVALEDAVCVCNPPHCCSSWTSSLSCCFETRSSMTVVKKNKTDHIFLLHVTVTWWGSPSRSVIFLGAVKIVLTFISDLISDTQIESRRSFCETSQSKKEAPLTLFSSFQDWSHKGR